ncbi:MAG: hypothetical protein GSR79_01350 [Desulfurococcales archaeon]|nr:hypothetical protein [Desulfurococcales archaeon]
MDVVVELTKSRTGKHAARRMAFIVNEHGGITELASGDICEECKTYAKGEAKRVKVKELSRDEYLVIVRLVRNTRGHVLGEITIYDWRQEPVFRAVYRKLKLRKNFGASRYAWIPRIIADKLKLYVKRYNLE